MKIIIFGSTGTIGLHLVQQALEKGHEVSAFCRDANKLEMFKHPKLKIITGDVFNPLEVDKAVKVQEAVCVVLGSGKKRKGTVRSQGTKHIIEAMKKNNIRRLICQTTLGVGDSNGNLNLFWKYFMFGWFLKEVFLDHILQEKYVVNSGLDWTIVRPSAFTDGLKTKNYAHGFGLEEKNLKLKISRLDVADFILKQIQSDTYLRKTPAVSY
jgi:putative NADH-flavin reductase